MRRLLPDSIAGWVLLVVVTGLTVGQAATLAVNAASRSEVSSVLAHFRLADRMADLVRLVEAVPPAQRSPLLATMKSGTLTATWDPAARRDSLDTGDQRSRLFVDVLQAALWDVPWRALWVSFAPATGDAALPGGRPSDRSTQLGRKLDSILAEHARVPIIHVALQLDDGSWINFSAPFVEDPASVSPTALALFALAALIIIGVSAWAVRRLTSPLATLAGAADRLGSDFNAPPLPENGARELRQAAHTFNTMQVRLQQFVRDRLQMTAAISHDLRTPITRMRLRAELVDDGELRGQMLQDLAEMEALIDATLSYAREESTQEPAEVLDLLSLVEDACEGRPDVRFVEEPDHLGTRLPVSIRPLALRRALGNLIDNAIKYGERARVSVTASVDRAQVHVDDDGPGIPDADQARVFEPYQRLDRSRNSETGGVGLGLAIARGIARAHGGDVHLANRPAGGLRATIELPRVGS